VKTVARAATADASQLRKANPYGNLGRISRLLAPAVARPFAILESVVLVVLALVVCKILVPFDPLLLHAAFPWFWLVPLVLALRYGTLLAVLAGCLMLGAWYVLYPAGSPWPSLYFAGGLIQTIIAGHFGDTWGSRARHTTALNNYLNDRLVALTDSHYLLRLSHERLEKDLLSKPTTLRDAILELRRLSIAGGGEQTSAQTHGNATPSLGAAHGLLEFIGRACQLEVAALYPVTGVRIGETPAAHIGDPFPLNRDDAMVTHAIETMGVAHLKNVEANNNAAQPISEYLVCAPLLSADGELRALLIVKRMPFLSLNFDNLQMLLVLLSYYADGVGHSVMVRHIIDALPECPPEFALDMSRLTRLRQRTEIESSLAALVFPRDEEGDSLFEHVTRRRRSLDVSWAVRNDRYSVLVNLMPATNAAGVGGYLARIESSLAAQFNSDFERSRIAVHTVVLDGVDPAGVLKRLLQRSGIDA